MFFNKASENKERSEVVFCLKQYVLVVLRNITRVARENFRFLTPKKIFFSYTRYSPLVSVSVTFGLGLGFQVSVSVSGFQIFCPSPQPPGLDLQNATEENKQSHGGGGGCLTKSLPSL